MSILIILLQKVLAFFSYFLLVYIFILSRSAVPKADA